MFETADELAEMQDLLDASAAGAGGHLREIVTDERRPSAAEICAEMAGMRTRPAVSATYLPSEYFALSVHGPAELMAFQSDAAAGLRQAMLDHYVPIQGASFGEWVATLDAVAVAIHAEQMFAFRMSD